MEKKTGCGCKADLKKEAREIVKNVEGYTTEDRVKKEKEVKAAFGEDKKKAPAKK